MPPAAVRTVHSGEIVTGAHRASGLSCDVIDADFITLSDGSRHDDSVLTASSTAENPSNRMRSLAAGHIRTGARAGPVFWMTGSVLVAAAFWLSGGHATFERAYDRTSGPPQMRVTRFESRIEAGGGAPVLFVEGELLNEARSEAAVPPLAIDVSTEQGLTRYLIGESGGLISARGRFRFSGRLAVPPGKVAGVNVVVGDSSTFSAKGI